MIEAGPEGTITSASVAYGTRIRRLTWEGHDFLAQIRSETVWAKTKQTAVEKGADLSFSIIKALSAKITMDILGLS